MKKDETTEEVKKQPKQVAINIAEDDEDGYTLPTPPEGWGYTFVPSDKWPELASKPSIVAPGKRLYRLVTEDPMLSRGSGMVTVMRRLADIDALQKGYDEDARARLRNSYKPQNGDKNTFGYLKGGEEGLDEKFGVLDGSGLIRQ